MFDQRAPLRRLDSVGLGDHREWHETGKGEFLDAPILRLQRSELSRVHRAVDLDPENGKLQKNLAHALIDRHRAGEAAVHARRAVMLRPNDPGAHDLLGRALAEQGNIPDARTEFERALVLDPSAADARDDLTSLRRGLRRVSER